MKVRLNILPDSRDNLGPIRAWPHPRPKSQRPYPLPTPSHPLLVETLCPTRTSLTSREVEGLRWAEIKELCR